MKPRSGFPTGSRFAQDFRVLFLLQAGIFFDAGYSRDFLAPISMLSGAPRKGHTFSFS